jgi:hypothetical protein
MSHKNSLIGTAKFSRNTAACIDTGQIALTMLQYLARTGGLRVLKEVVCRKT